MTNKESFNAMKTWVAELLQFGNKNISLKFFISYFIFWFFIFLVIAIAANKSDLLEGDVF
ncbi:MAG: hypothetical protein ACK56F_17170 [bacterium]